MVAGESGNETRRQLGGLPLPWRHYKLFTGERDHADDLAEYRMGRARGREKNHRRETAQHQGVLPGGGTGMRVIRDQQL